MTSGELMALIKKNPLGVGCGVISLLLGAGIYFRSDAIPSAEMELVQKTTEAERLELNIKYAAQLKEQLDELVVANKEIDSRIIRAREVGVNSGYFYKLESDTEVKLVVFTPLPPVPSAKGSTAAFTSVGYNLSVQGTWSQVLDFLRLLEGGSRYSRVLTTSVTGAVTNRKGPLTLSLSIELLGLP